MAMLDTKHDRAALVILVLGAALIVALSPFATGLIGIPVLYVIFQPLHGWLAKRSRPRLSAALITVLALFLIVVPGVSFAGLVVSQAQEIAGGVVQSPLLSRLSQLHLGEFNVGPPLADLGGKLVSWLGSSAFGLLGTATRLALNLTIALFGLYYILLQAGPPWKTGAGSIPFSAQNTDRRRPRVKNGTHSTRHRARARA